MSKTKRSYSDKDLTGGLRIRPVWNDPIDAGALSRAIIALVLHDESDGTGRMRSDDADKRGRP